MTATQASRNFAALLDAVERGETVLVTRDGVPIGEFVPVPATTVDRIVEVFERFPLDTEAADELDRIITENRATSNNQERRWDWG